MNIVLNAILAAAILAVAAESTSYCSHPPTCTLPQVLSTATCTCVCPHAPHEPCISPKFFDTNTCQCECLKDVHGQCAGQDRDIGAIGVQTCKYAKTAAECSKARCTKSESEVHGKRCVYLQHFRQCVCPCCEAATDKRFSFWCLHRSLFPKDACIPGFCNYVC